MPPTADALLVKEKAVRKHTSFDRCLNEGTGYVLLDPDRSEVEKMSGSTESFRLERYKEEVGKNYNRITLFVATKTDIQLSVLRELRDGMLSDNSSGWHNATDEEEGKDWGYFFDC